MQTAQVIIENHQKNVQVNASSETGLVGSLLARVFGCWHKEMSRPLSIQGQSYRTCLDCGARRQFNVNSWEMQGDYYYGLPNRKQFRALGVLAAQQAGFSRQPNALHHAG